MFGNLTWNHFDLAPRRKVMIMRRPTVHLAHVLAGGAIALLLSACGQGSTATAPVESASSAAASGAIASADVCPEGPPARGWFRDNVYGDDGVVGTVTNNTGASVWVIHGTHRTPCQLDAGKGVAYSGDIQAEIFVAATPEARSGTYIRLQDLYLGYPIANVTGFKEFLAYDDSCGADYREEFRLSEGESKDFDATNGAGYTGKVTVTRLPDDEKAANEYTGSTDGTDDWARMDVTVSALGYCS